MGIFDTLFSKTSTPVIFIIEDNEIYSATLANYLKMNLKDVTIKSFKVGEIAVDSATRPDLIVLDYNLNSEYFDAADGLSILKEFDAKWGAIAVIMLTKQEKVQVAVDAAKRKYVTYIEKGPSAFEKVAEKAKSILFD